MRGGIVELDRGQQQRKITAAESLGRESINVSAPDMEAITFVVKEEKGTIASLVKTRNDDRASYGKTKVILFVRGSRHAQKIVGPVVSVQGFVVQIVVGGAMQLVCP